MKRSTKNYQRPVILIVCAGKSFSAVTVTAAFSGVALLSTFAAVLAGIPLEGDAGMCSSNNGRPWCEPPVEEEGGKHDHIRKSAETVIYIFIYLFIYFY